MSALSALTKETLGETTIAAIAKAVTAASRTDAPIEQNEAPAVAAAVTNAIAADPAFVNASNNEPIIQSRVVNGGAAGFIGGLGVLVPLVASWLGYDIAPGRVVEIGFAVLAVVGPLYALYGRLVPGLKPMWSQMFPRKPLFPNASQQ